MLPPMDDKPPSAEEDPLVTAARVVELVGLCLYCLVLWQLLQPEPTGLSRWWARQRLGLRVLTTRALIPWRAKREAPYLVWEALTAMEAGR
jgi:hypothetical protein